MSDRSNFRRPSGPQSGFSMVELMITLGVVALVMLGLFGVITGMRRYWSDQKVLSEAQQEARTVLGMVTRDLRSAGYGVDMNTTPRQPAFAYADANEIVINENILPYPDTSTVRKGPPQAFNPSGALKPATIAGAYLPASKYATGAEMVRYTLDVNNDGVINTSDRTDPLASAELPADDPNSWLLVRQVYGDSSGSTPTSGNNGGTLQAVGVVHLDPGASLFKVYIGGSSTPYDWTGGPVPFASLDRISQVKVNITGVGRKKLSNKTLPTISLESTVGTLRNKPQGTTATYTVDGWVYSDVNRDVNYAAPPDSGIKNVVVRLGAAQVTKTNGSGYFIFLASAGAYTLSYDISPGFKKESADTFSVVVNSSSPTARHNFADTALVGGTMLDSAYLDANGNGYRDAGEVGLAGVSILANGTTATTNSSGATSHFLPPGSWTVTATGPDTVQASTTNPLTVTMIAGATINANFGFKPVTTATVKGTVFSDLNKDGVKQSGEAGVASVWVAVIDNNTGNVQAWQNTDVNGNYRITVPENLSTHNPPYRVEFSPPAGFFPTGPNSYGPFYVAARDSVTYNFGTNSYTVITLNASRVLSLTSADLLEQDWSGNINQWASKGHQDSDLILGSEYVSAANLSVWFNQYSGTPYFNATPDYSRDAKSSVLSIAARNMDKNAIPSSDVVTGQQFSASGNFAYWQTQITSGNMGYVPSAPLFYTTQDLGDANAVQLADLGGSAEPDILVGTSTATDHGSIELWLNSGATNATFARDEIWPPSGGVPGGVMGSVRCMVLADVNGDGWQDIVVGTRTSPYSGAIMIFKGLSKTKNNRFTLIYTKVITGEVQSLAVGDLDGDGKQDIVYGTVSGASSGSLEILYGDGAFGFPKFQSVTAPGQVQSVAVADMGGDTSNDVILGYRASAGIYTGGVRVYYMSGGWLTPTGTDPSGGAQPYWTPAVNIADFNYGVQPSTPSPPYLKDIATAVKTGATTGAVVVYIR